VRHSHVGIRALLNIPTVRAISEQSASTAGEGASPLFADLGQAGT